MSMLKKPAPSAVKYLRPFALSLLTDILAAALLVLGNYYFLYEAPIQGLGGRPRRYRRCRTTFSHPHTSRLQKLQETPRSRHSPSVCGKSLRSTLPIR